MSRGIIWKEEFNLQDGSHFCESMFGIVHNHSRKIQ